MWHEARNTHGRLYRNLEVAFATRLAASAAPSPPPSGECDESSLRSPQPFDVLADLSAPGAARIGASGGVRKEGWPRGSFARFAGLHAAGLLPGDRGLEA